MNQIREDHDIKLRLSQNIKEFRFEHLQLETVGWVVLGENSIDEEVV